MQNSLRLKRSTTKKDSSSRTFFTRIGRESRAEVCFQTDTSYVLNWRLALGVGCYIAVMGLFIAAFKYGGSLTVLYPLYASTFIWAALIGLRAYGTPIRPINVAGMVIIVAGMWLLGK